VHASFNVKDVLLGLGFKKKLRQVQERKEDK
jgi:hypothetical protein